MFPLTLLLLTKMFVLVMAGLVPAIHVFLASGTKDVDARLKAGHDELNYRSSVTLSEGLNGPYIARS